MSDDVKAAIAAHAAEHDLIDRLRGRSFIPGIHYGSQADAWMLEAADEIERLRALVPQPRRTTPATRYTWDEPTGPVNL